MTPPLTDRGEPLPGTAVVHLTIPAEARFLRIARLVVAGLGADADLTIDDIDDLRVAVDEVGSVLLDAEGDDQLELRFVASTEALRISARRPGVRELPSLHPVSRALLDATTGGFEMRLAADALEVEALRAPARRS